MKNHNTTTLRESEIDRNIRNREVLPHINIRNKLLLTMKRQQRTLSPRSLVVCDLLFTRIVNIFIGGK